MKIQRETLKGVLVPQRHQCVKHEPCAEVKLEERDLMSLLKWLKASKYSPEIQSVSHSIRLLYSLFSQAITEQTPNIPMYLARRKPDIGSLA